MINRAKSAANSFIKRHKLTDIDYPALKTSAENLGYTVIEFNSTINESDVETVISNLNLKDMVTKSRGFTFASGDQRLIFINEDLNSEEKLFVLSHEIGHIECGHFSSSVIGNDVREEHEANEFSHYLLKNTSFSKMKRFLSRHRKAFIIGAVLLCLCIGILITYLTVENKKMYKDNLYITTSGKCYHREECIFVKNKNNTERLTKKDFESGIYSPCDICLPDEN